MINTNRLISMARKWQKLAATRTRRISTVRKDGVSGAEKLVTKKGHFVIYTCDERRFVIPLAYLSNCVFRKLLDMAEEEFGLPGNGPIMLPCEAVFMEYAISLVEKQVSKDLEKALLMFLSNPRSCNPCGLHKNPQLLVEGFC